MSVTEKEASVGTGERPPRIQRYRSNSALEIGRPDGRPDVLRQEAPTRFFRPYPEPGEPPTAVIANIAGGIAGGDHVGIDVRVPPAGSALVTGQAAEKVYRSDGSTASLDVALTVGAGGALEFLPQGTILFDGAKLDRRTTIDLNPGSALLFGEILYFGRTSMGESLKQGALSDRVDIRRDGQRLWTDAFRLAGDLEASLGASSTLNAATATGLLVWVGEYSPGLLEEIRTRLPGTRDTDCLGAAATFESGPLVVRWVGQDAAAVRKSFGSVWSLVRSTALGHPNRMPKIWSI